MMARILPIWNPAHEGELVIGRYMGERADWFILRACEDENGREHKIVCIRKSMVLTTQLDSYSEGDHIAIEYGGMAESRTGRKYHRWTVDGVTSAEVKEGMP
jgi:hypothetical protein